jgi:hypothetical protein
LTGRQPSGRNLLRAVPEGHRHADAAKQLHQGRQAGQGSRHLHVRPEQMIPGAAELPGFVRFGSERLDDAVAGKRLGADVRQLLERLLAAPGRAAHALSQPDQRIHNQRRAGHADQGEPRVQIKHERRVAHERE